MLDRADFESWQQCIRLYCMGKDNGENIIKSIDKGPFKMGKFRETLAEGAEGALHLGPERDRVVADLTPEEKERYKADIRATNILLQGLPKDIYTLINHYTDANDIWDNVKMLLEGFELTKDDRESQLYDEFEHFRQNKGFTLTDDLIENLTKTVALLAQSYKTYIPQTNNQLRTSSNTWNQATVQNGRVVVDRLTRLMMMWMRHQYNLALNKDNVFQADHVMLLILMLMRLLLHRPCLWQIYHQPIQSMMKLVFGVSYDSDILSETTQCVSANEQRKVVNALLTAKLTRYKEQVKLYKRRARFELNEREHKIDEQLRIIIIDRNIKEETLKKELHSVKMQLNSTINHNKLMVEEVTTLKKDFKQKENKYLEEFLDMKALK
ncbi:hypothetical protein Tco_1525272 [Tanacetum coccineum]